MTSNGQKNTLSPADLRKLHHQMPRWVITLAVLGIAAVVASRIAHLLATLTVAAVIAYIFSSVISFLERAGIKRSIAVLQLFLFAAAFVILGDLVLAGHLKRETMNAYAKLPEFSRQIEAALLSGAENSAKTSPVIESGLRKLVANVFGPGGLLERTLNVSELLTQATPFIMGFILVPFFAFFMLKDWPKVLKRAMAWVPPFYVETTVSVIAEINILVGQYLRGLAADCLFIGLLASLGLWVMGVNYPILLGVMSGVVNIVPYLGPLMACLVSCLVALAQFHTLDPVLNVVLLYLALKLLDDLFLQPMMIGRSVELHPMLLVITIMVGEKLFGISGMILGVPVVTAAQKTLGIVLDHRRETLRRESAGGPILNYIGNPPVRPI
jgi:predicted PurR-regulated permease PerM